MEAPMLPTEAIGNLKDNIWKHSIQLFNIIEKENVQNEAINLTLKETYRQVQTTNYFFLIVYNTICYNMYMNLTHQNTDEMVLQENNTTGSHLQRQLPWHIINAISAKSITLESPFQPPWGIFLCFLEPSRSGK